MGFADGLRYIGGSLSPVQPNPLKRTSITSYEAAAKPIAERSDGTYGVIEGQAKIIAHACDDEAVQKPTRKRKRAIEGNDEERGRVWRKKMPQKSQVLLDRALSNTLFIIDRIRAGTEDCPEEMIDLAGSTGNIYTIHIKKRPTCTCPAYEKTIKPGNDLGDECKHILYLAFLSSELREIFANAPPIPSGSPSDSSSSSSSNRKPIEDDCPICCCPFDTESDNADDIVWCKASCGNNIHKTCFEQWAATKKVANYGSAAPVTCPFCRSRWQGDEDSLKKIAKCGEKNAEGYVNVAEQLGISQERDTSTYHQPWVRQQQKAGKLPRYY
ncbi:MAG: hypothetical protein Q9157_003005 [Trypethelium eluteriae]